MIRAPELRYTTVGKKQAGDNARWQYVWDHIGSIVSRETIEHLVETTVAEVKRTVGTQKVGWAWSGGKDSQALRVVMERAGIERCVLGMTEDLEYPAFLRWTTDHMPWGLDVIATPQDLPWLAKNQHMLFPQDSKTAGEWFKFVQHTAQRVFYERYGLDMLILGRRTADRNYVGEGGIYTNALGITRYSPIRHWTHEQVLGVCHYYQLPLPPCYGWINGWVVGSGNWAARQWTGSTRQGWHEVNSIDPSIVVKAAGYLPSAYDYVRSL